MRLLAAVAFTFAFTSAMLAQAAPDPLAEAVALFEAGRYDDAIAKLRGVLESDPSNDVARYELGLAYAAKGASRQCLDIFTPLAEKAGPLQASSLAMLGNCLDHLGQREKAIDAYRAGLKLSPEDASLLFNLAVSLGQDGKLAEALPLLEKNVISNPWHVTTHYLLGDVFELHGFRVPATMAFLRYLALEPSSQRSADAAKRVRALMGVGVEKTRKGANITINPDSRKEEGDFTSMEMMLAMLAASETMPEKKRMSEFERAQESTATAIRIFLESREAANTDFTSTTQANFFRALENEKLLDTFTGLALSSLNLRGTQPWLKANERELARYRAWITPQAKRAVTLPSLK